MRAAAQKPNVRGLFCENKSFSVDLGRIGFPQAGQKKGRTLCRAEQIALLRKPDMWIAEPSYCPKTNLRALFSFQPPGDEMANKKQGYKVTVAGAGHNFERDVEESLAAQIISLVMTGGASVGSGTMSGGIGPNAPKHSGGAHAAPHVAQVRGSLASHIKAKGGDKNQNTRFLATAEWLSGRSEDPLTAKAVATGLSDHNQKRLANPADCLNQNVRKGYCEKRKDGSFFITPEGLEALQGTPAE